MSEFNELMRLLNLAYPKRKPRLHTRRKPQRKKVAVFAKSSASDAPEPLMSATEAKARLSRATVHGTLTGTDAVALERVIDIEGVSIELDKLLRGVS